jgi:hypothetical protein
MWRRWKRGHDPARSGDGGLRWEEKRQRWIAEITIGYDGHGKRIVRMASRWTKTEAKTKLRYMLRDQADGLPVGSHRSKSLSARQADDVLTKTAPDQLHAYIIVSLFTGARTEDLRVLRWEYVHLDPTADRRT